MTTPTKSEAPFDTEAYANYKELVNNQVAQSSPNELSAKIMHLGVKLDQQLEQMISRLDYIIGGESDGN